jgi:hypothetical protein
MNGQLIPDDELDTLLNDRDPLTPGWDAHALGPVLARLERDIQSTTGVVSAHSRQRRVSRRLATAAASGILVAAAALVGVNVLAGGVTTDSLLPGTQLPEAQAAELNKIAAVAAGGPSAGRGKWLYLKVVTTEHQGLQIGNSPALFYSVTEALQIWGAGASGPTRMRVVFTNFSFASARARSMYESHRSTWTRALAEFPLPPKHETAASAVFQHDATLSPTEIGNGTSSKVPLSSLPSNPEALVSVLGRAHMKSLGPGSKDNAGLRRFISENQALGDWIALSQILVTSTSARQRAEAYRALTLVPYVRVVGNRRDSRGRLGTEVSFHLPGAASPTRSLIIDPRSGDLLQESTGSGSTTVWIGRALVKSDTDLPKGGKQPLPRLGSGSRGFPILEMMGGGLLP